MRDGLCKTCFLVDFLLFLNPSQQIRAHAVLNYISCWESKETLFFPSLPSFLSKVIGSKGTAVQSQEVQFKMSKDKELHYCIYLSHVYSVILLSFLPYVKLVYVYTSIHIFFILFVCIDQFQLFLYQFYAVLINIDLWYILIFARWRNHCNFFLNSFVYFSTLLNISPMKAMILFISLIAAPLEALIKVTQCKHSINIC